MVKPVPPLLLTVPQTAELLGVNASYVYAELKRGRDLGRSQLGNLTTLDGEKVRAWQKQRESKRQKSVAT